MYGHNAVPFAVVQRLSVDLAQFRGTRARRRHFGLCVNIGRDDVDTVAEVFVVDQYVQRNLAYPPLREIVFAQPRRRVGYDDDGHRTPASAKALSISSATPSCASKFQ